MRSSPTHTSRAAGTDDGGERCRTAVDQQVRGCEVEAPAASEAQNTAATTAAPTTAAPTTSATEPASPTTTEDPATGTEKP